MISLYEKTQFFREKWLPSQTGEVVLSCFYHKHTPATLHFQFADGTGVPFDAQIGGFWDEAAAKELIRLHREHNNRIREQTAPPSRGPCQLHDRETAKAEEARTVTGRIPSQPNEQWLPPNRVAATQRTVTDAELAAASSGSIKDTNPKDAIGDTKVPLDMCSPIASAHWALAQYAGARKYQKWNWRAAGVRSSVYISAMKRHIDAYLSGEEVDPVDGTHHLGNVMACAAIILDAQAAGKLNDDRPPVVGIRGVYGAVEAQMAVLRDKYAGIPQTPYTSAWTAGQPAAQVKK